MAPEDPDAKPQSSAEVELSAATKAVPVISDADSAVGQPGEAAPASPTIEGDSSEQPATSLEAASKRKSGRAVVRVIKSNRGNTYKVRSASLSSTSVSNSSSSSSSDSDDSSQSDSSEDGQSSDGKFTKICPVTERPHKTLVPFGFSKCPSCKGQVSDKCPAASSSHRTLRKFGVPRCPKCRKEITATVSVVKPSLREEASPSTSATEGGEAGGDTKQDGGDLGPSAAANSPVEETRKGFRFVHKVEFRDRFDDVFRTDYWNGPFDLQAEREKAKERSSGSAYLKPKAHEPTLQLITVLSTTIEDVDRRVKSWDVQRLLAKQDMSISVRTMRVVVDSKPFLAVLRAVLTYPTNDVRETLEMLEPYALVAHHIDPLRNHQRKLVEQISLLADDSSSIALRNAKAAAVADIDAVVGYVESTVGERIAAEKALHALRPEPSCTFRMLWLLFKPGDVVYTRSENPGKPMEAYVVDEVKTAEGILSTTAHALKQVKVKVWSLDLDSTTKQMRREHIDIEIEPFFEERAIDSLPLVPARIWDELDGGKLRKRLLFEGEKWFSLVSGIHMHYKGNFAGIRGASFEGRVYVDPLSWPDGQGDRGPPSKAPVGGPTGVINVVGAKPRHPGLGPLPGLPPGMLPGAPGRPPRGFIRTNDPWARFEGMDPTKAEAMDSRLGPDARSMRCLLVSKTIRAFVFKTRRWEMLYAANCEKPKLNKDPFLKLVMDERRKTMIKSLVAKHTDGKGTVWSADFIKNKGEGQIFLLHGPPGVGKTFTAECIAEFTGQPLLALTSGDLGTNEVEMESKLSTWLRLGHRWGAVMLIDEADVFLERRITSDLKRNSLVSVFLREVEYYRGILFLTTNRVCHFDDAFISRIHVVIPYKPFGLADRQKIWLQFFDKLKKERKKEIKIDPAAKRYVLENKEVTEVPLNGREIRNAFQTAVALAEYRFANTPDSEKAEGEKALLTMEDFKGVCEMMRAFKTYLETENRGLDEDSRAEKRGDRANETAGLGDSDDDDGPGGEQGVHDSGPESDSDISVESD